MRHIYWYNHPASKYPLNQSGTCQEHRATLSITEMKELNIHLMLDLQKCVKSWESEGQGGKYSLMTTLWNTQAAAQNLLGKSHYLNMCQKKSAYKEDWETSVLVLWHLKKNSFSSSQLSNILWVTLSGKP